MFPPPALCPQDTCADWTLELRDHGAKVAPQHMLTVLGSALALPGPAVCGRPTASVSLPQTQCGRQNTLSRGSLAAPETSHTHTHTKHAQTHTHRHTRTRCRADEPRFLLAVLSEGLRSQRGQLSAACLRLWASLGSLLNQWLCCLAVWLGG